MHKGQMTAPSWVGPSCPVEVGATSVKSPTLNEDDFDVTISNLPEKLGFTPKFLEEVERVGGNSLQMCHKL